MLVLDFPFWALLEQIIPTSKKVVLAFIWLDYESMTKIRRKKKKLDYLGKKKKKKKKLRQKV